MLPEQEVRHSASIPDFFRPALMQRASYVGRSMCSQYVKHMSCKSHVHIIIVMMTRDPILSSAFRYAHSKTDLS